MNELATTAELAEVNAIFADQGQNVEEVIKIPFLKVQYDSALFMKNPNCRMGMYSISGPHPIYAETVKMRVLLAHIQWRQQNSEDFKMVNKSILMDNRGQEPIDMLGGVRCGRPDPDLWKDMSDAERKPFKDRVCTHVLRGLVSYKGIYADGSEGLVDNQPVQFHMKGLNFMPIANIMRDFKKMGKNVRDVWLDMKTDLQGKTFVNNIEIDYSTPALLDSATVATVKVFNEQVRSENNFVKKQYYKAQGAVEHVDGADNDSYAAALEHSA
mgnify:FL=1